MRESTEWLRRMHPARADTLVATGLVALAQAESWLSPSVAGQRVETAVAGAMMAGALAVRRRWPFAVLVVVMGAFTALALTAGLPNVVFLLPVGLLAVYSVAAHCASDRAVLGLALALAVLAVGAIRIDDPTITDLTAPAVLFTAAWFAGRALRGRRLRSAELESHAAQLERDQEKRERAAVAEERARLARELHDIVAHRVTTIVIQAESGRVTSDEPERAREAFGAIGASGRQALAELRRLLGLLREDDPSAAAIAPQPGLAQVAQLVEDVREAGLPVEARLDEVGALPPGLDLAAYRIAQEGLTNALRHARTPTSITVGRVDGEVVVEVRNALAKAPAPGSDGAGHGLAGMRERVRVYGGRVTAGARAGEFVVRAALPIDEARL